MTDQQPPAPVPPQRDPAASMSLITELMTHPLDPLYADAAERRIAEGKPGGTSLRTPLVALTSLLVGLALAAAALTLRVPFSTAQKQHSQLVDQINARQKEIDTASAKIADLQKQINDAQSAALTKDNQKSLATRLQQLEISTGASAAKGPGFVLSVDNAKSAGVDANGNPRTDGSTQGTVTSADLQIIVNGIWAAGAEAIAINGQRLTAESAIRFAGQAVLVNYRALAPPYVISAIGPADMHDKFTSGPGAAYLSGLVKDFAVQETLSDKSQVQLPAAPAPAMEYAKVAKESP